MLANASFSFSKNMKPESIKPIYDPWNLSTWPREHFFWWSFFLLNMVFVWLTPLNVLDRYPQFVPFTDFMANWNTQIRRLGEYSGPANQANRFCSSVFWCVMPLLMLRMLFAEIDYRKKGRRVEMSYLKLFKSIAIMIVGMTILWILPNHPAESSRIGRSLFVNPLGRGFFLPAMVYIFGICAYLGFSCTADIVTRKLVIKGDR
jgi:hypothetical protein